MDFITFSISTKTTFMKLKLSLLLFCLLGIGIFSHAQDKKKAPSKPIVENGDAAIPVTVTSTKKAHRVPPPPPPPPKVVKAPKLTPPKMVNDGIKPPPPPPVPAKPASTKLTPPVKPDAPPRDQKA